MPFASEFSWPVITASGPTLEAAAGVARLRIFLRQMPAATFQKAAGNKCDAAAGDGRDQANYREDE